MQGQEHDFDQLHSVRVASCSCRLLLPSALPYTLRRRIVVMETKTSDLIKQTVETYLKHGWQLRRVLLRPDTIATLHAEAGYDSLPVTEAPVKEASIDALWFSRSSHQGREAWELRLLSENPFALFETFEEDETEEQREEMRWEMEAKLREHLAK
jgi:hypothetical protein